MSFCACFCALFSAFEAIFFGFCNFMLSNPIIIHGESGVFYQSSTRYLSSERNSDFTHLASHVENSKNG